MSRLQYDNLLYTNMRYEMSLQCLSTVNVVFSDEDKILIKSLYLKGYSAQRLTDEFPEKCWTKCGVNKLLKTLQDTGTLAQFEFLISQGSVATRLR